MARYVRFLPLLLLLFFAASCKSVDKNAPVITNITTSSKFLAKSDCSNTSLTVTATITDDTKVKSVEIMYRVGSDQQFTSIPMKLDGHDQYTATIITLEIPGGEYGPVEFSIVAKDEAGNQSKSAVDDSVQLLPCVAN